MDLESKEQRELQQLGPFGIKVVGYLEDLAAKRLLVAKLSELFVWQVVLAKTGHSYTWPRLGEAISLAGFARLKPGSVRG